MSATPVPADAAGLVNEIVAWHNRHPLARKVEARHVHSVGVVQLPFAAADATPAASPIVEPVMDVGEAGPDAPPPDAPADAAPKGEAPQAAAPAARPWWGRLADLWPGTGAKAPMALFTERFAPPLTPRRIATFAGRLGHPSRPGGEDWPLRDVDADTARRTAARSAGLAGEAPRYLLTAAIDSHGRRLRLLAARSGGRLHVIGPRAWDAWKVGPLAGLLVGALVGAGGTGAWGVWAGAPADEVVAHADTAEGRVDDVHAASAKPAGHASADTTAAAPHDAGHGNVPTGTGEATPQGHEPAASGVPAGPPARVETRSAGPLKPDLADAARAASERETAAWEAFKGTPEGALAVARLGPTAAAQAIATARGQAAPDAASAASGADNGQAVPTQAANPPQGTPVAATPARGPAHGAPAPSARVDATATVPAAMSRSPAAAKPGRHYAVLAPRSEHRSSAALALREMKVVAGASRERVDGPLSVDLFGADGALQPALWPFADRAEAERVREWLRDRGVATSIVEF